MDNINHSIKTIKHKLNIFETLQILAMNDNSKYIK